MVQRAAVIALLCAVAFALSAGAVYAFLLTVRRRLVAQPGARSSHSRPTPTGGGLPTVAAFLLVACFAVQIGVIAGGPRWWAAVLCAGTLGLLGLLDDACDLPRSLRYAAQLVIAATTVHWLGHPGPSGRFLGKGVLLASVVGYTALVNAFNFMDGIDALVAGTGAVICGFLAWFTGDPIWFLLACSYGGFLVFNIPPARIFMGDAGSTALGGLVGVAVLSGHDSLRPGQYLIFGPLLGDSAYTIARRLIRGENIFMAHHSHVYQRLLRAGHSHAVISGGYAATTMALGLLVARGNNVAAVAGASGCATALALLELHLARRKIPFTRSSPDRASAS
jgi:UDP-N-acetylmuramyl pentapeptide phosphotransferase/UDP-N-acetylglucosamine-1-phosphate transferase